MLLLSQNDETTRNVSAPDIRAGYRGTVIANVTRYHFLDWHFRADKTHFYIGVTTAQGCAFAT